MSDNHRKEKPEVYALQQNGSGWQISRRDFLKTAGIGTAVMGVGLGSRFVRPAAAAEDLDTLCKSAPAHKDGITDLLVVPGSNMLVSRDDGGTAKCWDFRNYSLYGSVEDAFKNEKPSFISYFEGGYAVFSEKLDYYYLPLDGFSEMRSVGANVKGWKYCVMDTSENIYGVKDDKNIYCLRKENNYSGEELLCSPGRSVKSLRMLTGSSRLFMEFDGAFAVFDPGKKELKINEVNCSFYTILPGESRVLIYEKDTYHVNSLIDGSLIWSRSSDDLGPYGMADRMTASPDGSLAIMCSGSRVWVISLADGTILHNKYMSDTSGFGFRPVVSPDSSKAAISSGNSILFYSLPDMKLIGCPVDLADMKNDSKGIEISDVDPLTGRT
ncbi:MAG: twin-arginine translocation signal domain-containing protein, partial [Anaerolineaceae bacterium]|nr:twin-arginine translocation signal domain-containing protein [Anaerolineaceae bacterium]